MRRHALQGLWTVVRFNWHLHALALALAGGFLTAAWFLNGWPAVLSALAGIATLASITVSLAATWWAYDASGLYAMDWLREDMTGVAEAANLHAGFDETSLLLEIHFPDISWLVFDFYDPAKHTEISIRRARRSHPPRGNTRSVTTDALPLADGSMDRVLLFLAAHEIRDHAGRMRFFREINRVLSPGGRVIVTEHPRDLANITAYSIGAWHFHSRTQWLATFRAAGFRIEREFHNNLFITTFVLQSDEAAR